MTGRKPSLMKAILLAAVCALMAMSAAPAWAYNAQGSAWGDNSTSYQLDNFAYDDPGYTSVESVTLTKVYRAVAKWNATPATSYSISVSQTAAEVTPTSGDGLNTIGFVGLGASSDAVSITMISTTSTITEADIYLNTDKCLSAVSTTGCYEVESLMLYALGYAAGLTRTSTAYAVMNDTYSVSPGTFRAVTLTNDDMQGLVSVYDESYTATGTDVRTIPGLVSGDMNATTPITQTGSTTVVLDGRDDIVYVDTKGYVYYTADLSNWDKIGENKFNEIAAGDVDSDGYDNDLAGINLNSYMLYSTDTTNWSKIGSNKFTKLAFGDIGNVDGYSDDLAGINLNQYILYSSDTTNWNKIGANKFTSLLSGDVNGDGYNDDLAGINLNQYMLYTTDTSNWNKIGANKFTKMAYYDYDKDGKKDELIGLNLNQYILYSSDTTNWTKIGANKFSTMAVGDLDRDGYANDIAAINLNQYILYTTDSTNWTKIGANKFNNLIVLDVDDDGYEDDIAGVNLNNHVLYTTDLSTWTQITKP